MNKQKVSVSTSNKQSVWTSNKLSKFYNKSGMGMSSMF